MKIIKRFLKANSKGEKFSEIVEELVPNEYGTVNATKNQLVFNCPSCGQFIEENQIRYNCPVCKGHCCNFGHEERVKHAKSLFERQIIIEKETLRWLESKVFDDFPGIEFIRKIVCIKSVKRLEELRQRLGVSDNERFLP